MNYQDLVDQHEAAKANGKLICVSADGKTVSICDPDCADRREKDGAHVIRNGGDLLGYEFSHERPT